MISQKQIIEIDIRQLTRQIEQKEAEFFETIKEFVEEITSLKAELREKEEELEQE